MIRTARPLNSSKVKKISVMAGQAKRDPATQDSRGSATKRLPQESLGRADARPLDGRLKAGQDD
jgi:hypothetical protein